MKMFSVAVAVAVALTFIWIQESSAVPVTEVQELEEPVGNDKPDAAHEETSLNSRMVCKARWSKNSKYVCVSNTLCVTTISSIVTEM
uniref:Uncharacterized protein n=1 Tax=Monopterus albus TaxID=43700 RepID=A0A3Q3II13_MONAL